MIGPKGGGCGASGESPRGPSGVWQPRSHHCRSVGADDPNERGVGRDPSRGHRDHMPIENSLQIACAKVKFVVYVYKL